LGRSRERAKPQHPTSSRSGAGPAPVPTLSSATVPRVWQGIGYRPLPDAAQARSLFEFAALPWPAGRDIVFAWGASAAADGAERLVGAVVAERSGSAVMLHGPVVTAGEAPLEIAAQLVAAALDHATAAGAATVFVRPQGLDRVWVRFGFIPVPESTLPAGLAGHAGVGLYAWRGGSALWTLRENATA
jgi:hypothetical protein